MEGQDGRSPESITRFWQTLADELRRRKSSRREALSSAKQDSQLLAVDSDLEYVESESGHFYPTECRLATVSLCNHLAAEELTHSPHLSKRVETSRESLTPSAVVG
jgi:hypothetical protein